MFGLGSTVDEWELQNGRTPLGKAVESLEKDREGTLETETELSDVELKGSEILVSGEHLAFLDDAGWEALGSLFGIPSAYMSRIGVPLKRQNVEWWAEQNAEKEVVLCTKDGDLVEARAGKRISVLDCMKAVLEGPEDWKPMLMTSRNGKGSVCFDVYDDEAVYDTERDSYMPGLRVECFERFVAPTVSPILVSANSCGVLEFSDFVEPLSIKSLGMKDIMRLLSEQADVSFAACDGLFSMLASMAEDRLEDPRHRLSLYCRENSVPDRAKSAALELLPEGDVRKEHLVALFSCLGFVGSIKWNAARKCQRLSGRIVLKDGKERRCSECDSLLVED